MKGQKVLEMKVGKAIGSAMMTGGRLAVNSVSGGVTSTLMGRAHNLSAISCFLTAISHSIVSQTSRGDGLFHVQLSPLGKSGF
jgi:hypothetical protein